MTPKLGRALFSVIDIIDELGIRYALVGGLAVGAWGVNRSTRDVDLYADIAPIQHAALERSLREHGFHVPAMEAELERFGVFRSRSPERVFVDIFSAVGPLGAAILDRRKSVSVGGRSLWLVAPEDLAVLKAFSERERDFEDLANLSAVLGSRLDVSYIQHWARALDESIGGNDVSERVQRALTQSRSPKGQGKRRRQKKTP